MGSEEEKEMNEGKRRRQTEGKEGRKEGGSEKNVKYIKRRK